MTTTRTVLARHEATQANMPWSVTHDVSVNAGNDFDEYVLAVGDRSLAFDPRERDDRIQMHEIANTLHEAALRHPAKGATHAQLCELLEELADVVGVPGLAGLAETLNNLHSEPGEDRDTLTLAEHRVELGLCPAEGSHLAKDCARHECTAWADDRDADYVGVTR